MFRLLATACLLAAALSLTACGDGNPDNRIAGTVLSVYMSLPLEGELGDEGEEIANAAKLALADADGKAGAFELNLTILDDTAGRPARWTPGEAAANARRASQDSRTIAFIGDFNSGATRISLPILNQAGIAQVSPASGAVELTREVEAAPNSPERFYPTGRRTFARLVPDDGLQARAAATWASDLDVSDVAVIRAQDGTFARVSADAFTEKARDEGIDVGRTVDGGPGAASKVADADAVYYAGEPDDDTLSTLRALLRRDVTVFASDAVLLDADLIDKLGSAADNLRLTGAALPVSELGAEGRRFARAYERQFGSEPGPYAAYGYEAMALLIETIRAAGVDGSDRPTVIRRLQATSERDSVLGRYSITGDGDTTLDRIAGFEIRDGRPSLDRVLEPGD
ncbi:MAG: branched-chain amino acid ABC transporter substrate-binding protein [Solirubrobacterales bacterium]